MDQSTDIQLSLYQYLEIGMDQLRKEEDELIKQLIQMNEKSREYQKNFAEKQKEALDFINEQDLKFQDVLKKLQEKRKLSQEKIHQLQLKLQDSRKLLDGRQDNLDERDKQFSLQLAEMAAEFQRMLKQKSAQNSQLKLKIHIQEYLIQKLRSNSNQKYQYQPALSSNRKMKSQSQSHFTFHFSPQSQRSYHLKNEQLGGEHHSSSQRKRQRQIRMETGFYSDHKQKIQQSSKSQEAIKCTAQFNQIRQLIVEKCYSCIIALCKSIYQKKYHFKLILDQLTHFTTPQIYYFMGKYYGLTLKLHQMKEYQQRQDYMKILNCLALQSMMTDKDTLTILNQESRRIVVNINAEKQKRTENNCLESNINYIIFLMMQCYPRLQVSKIDRLALSYVMNQIIQTFMVILVY